MLGFCHLLCPQDWGFEAEMTPGRDLIPEEEWPIAHIPEPLPPCDGRVFHEPEPGLNDEEILPLWWDWVKGPVPD